MQIEIVDWRNTPEIARSMYSTFKHRSKSELREYGTRDTTMWVIGRDGKHLVCALAVYLEHYRKKFTFVEWLFVPKTFRGMGFGSLMISGAREWFGPLALTVGDYNRRALHFYFKRGFKENKYWGFMSYYGHINVLTKD